MRHKLKPKHTNFLEMLQELNGINVLKLSPADRMLVMETLSVGYYFDYEAHGLNRLRTRWKEPRPDAGSNEYY